MLGGTQRRKVVCCHPCSLWDVKGQLLGQIDQHLQFHGSTKHLDPAALPDSARSADPSSSIYSPHRPHTYPCPPYPPLSIARCPMLLPLGLYFYPLIPTSSQHHIWLLCWPLLRIPCLQQKSSTVQITSLKNHDHELLLSGSVASLFLENSNQGSCCESRTNNGLTEDYLH
jgi:hypothetical protein